MTQQNERDCVEAVLLDMLSEFTKRGTIMISHYAQRLKKLKDEKHEN